LDIDFSLTARVVGHRAFHGQLSFRALDIDHPATGLACAARESAGVTSGT